jgi:hypothetical protein
MKQHCCLETCHLIIFVSILLRFRFRNRNRNLDNYGFGSGSSKAKSYGPYGSGSAALEKKYPPFKNCFPGISDPN